MIKKNAAAKKAAPKKKVTPKKAAAPKKKPPLPLGGYWECITEKFTSPNYRWQRNAIAAAKAHKAATGHKVIVHT